MNQENTYIVAVSGGVDSVVLLHKLIEHRNSQETEALFFRPARYIVAHFDHGIRDDSAKDEEFVQKLARNYGLEYVTECVSLGAHASEALAREIRYKFLEEQLHKYNASAIITAHHEDDVLETMIINMIRGTSPRGLVGFGKQNVVRPMLQMSKKSIYAYVKKHKLQWREDSTNQDERYLRNYVRLKITSQLSTEERQKFLEIRKNIQEKYIEIDDISKKLLVSMIRNKQLVRTKFVILPYIVQCELVALWFRLNNVQFQKSTIERAVMAIKTLQPSKKHQIVSGNYLLSTSQYILLKVDPQHV